MCAAIWRVFFLLIKEIFVAICIFLYCLCYTKIYLGFFVVVLNKEIFVGILYCFCTEQRNICSSLYYLVLFCAEHKTKLWKFLLFCIVLYWTKRVQSVLQFVWRVLSNALFNFEEGLMKKVYFLHLWNIYSTRQGYTHYKLLINYFQSFGLYGFSIFITSILFVYLAYFLVQKGSWLLSNAFFNFEMGLMKRVYFIVWKGSWFWLFTHFCAIKSPRRKCTSWKEQELQSPVFGSISVRQLCFASGYTLN